MPREELGSSAVFDCIVVAEDGILTVVVVRLDDATEEDPLGRSKLLMSRCPRFFGAG
jgi:hypothetical protein